MPSPIAEQKVDMWLSRMKGQTLICPLCSSRGWDWAARCCSA